MMKKPQRKNGRFGMLALAGMILAGAVILMGTGQAPERPDVPMQVEVESAPAAKDEMEEGVETPRPGCCHLRK